MLVKGWSKAGASSAAVFVTGLEFVPIEMPMAEANPVGAESGGDPAAASVGARGQSLASNLAGKGSTFVGGGVRIVDA